MQPNAYDLNFTELVKEYKDQKQCMIPFIKSEFIYACRLGDDTTLPSPVNRQMLLTMELVQKPINLKYTGFGQERQKADRQALEERLEEQQGIFYLLKRERSSLNSRSRLRLSNIDGADDSGESSEENTFSGNMFHSAGEPQKILKRHGIQGGIENNATETFDSVLISLWDIGGEGLRYKRIMSTLVPHPPVDKDLRCYLSHSGDAVYWLGKKSEAEGDTCLVVFDKLEFLETYDKEDLQQTPYQVYDISKLKNFVPDAGKSREKAAPQAKVRKTDPLPTLFGSSLIHGNSVLCCRVKNLDRDGQENYFWAFWDINKQRMRRKPLSYKIERVFFKKESRAFVVESPDDFYVLAFEYQPNVQVEDKQQQQNKRKLDLPEPLAKLATKVRPQFHFEHQKHYRLYRVKFNVEQSRISEAWPEHAHKLLQYTETKAYISAKEFERSQSNLDQSTLSRNAYKSNRRSDATDMRPPSQMTVLQSRTNFIYDEDEEQLKFEAKSIHKDQRDMANRFYAHNDNMSIFIMIIKGKYGEQHKIMHWDLDSMYKNWNHFDRLHADAQDTAVKTEFRSGNNVLDFNQNYHNSRLVFLIQIQNKVITAKPFVQDVRSGSESVRGGPILPELVLRGCSSRMPVDVWLEPSHGKTDMIKSVGKSAADQFLNCSSLSGIYSWQKSGRDYQVLDVGFIKLKTQDLNLIYPVVCHNIGDNLVVQSLTRKNEAFILTLPCEESFVTFLNYHTLENVGFRDSVKGEKTKQQAYAFEEAATRIAFMVRRDHERSTGHTQHQMVIKMLEIDPYAEEVGLTVYETSYPAGMKMPPRFPGHGAELYQNHGNEADGIAEKVNMLQRAFSFRFIKKMEDKSRRTAHDEAAGLASSSRAGLHGAGRQQPAGCSSDSDEDEDAGVRDDFTHRAYTVKINSQRGPDIAFVCQYNDCIIFDCITNTTQQPIQIPRLDNHYDSHMNFQDMAVCKGGEMVTVPMIMDSCGAIYFMVRQAKREIKIYRHNSEAVMGDENFIQEVASIATEKVFFMVVFNQKFYVMDSKMSISKFSQDPNTKMLNQEQSYCLQKADMRLLEHVDFDEYVVTNHCFHRDDQVFFLRESIVDGQNATWQSEEITKEGFEYFSGPMKFKGSDAVAYIWTYLEQEEHDLTKKSSVSVRSDRKGNWLVVMPMADQSSLDILPQHQENHVNFTSYISSDKIMCNYSGRFLIFNQNGDFVQTVKAEFSDLHTDLKEQQRKFSRMKLDTVSDNMKYFVFRELKKQKKSEDSRVKIDCYEQDLESKSTVNVEMNFYVFELHKSVCDHWLGNNVMYKFVQQPISTMVSKWPILKFNLTTHMCVTGKFNQTQIIGVEPSAEDPSIDIVTVECYSKSIHDSHSDGVSTQYVFKFPNQKELSKSKKKLRSKLSDQKNLQSQLSQAVFDRIYSIKNRLSQIKTAWVVGQYLLVCYGKHIKYICLENQNMLEQAVDLPLELTSNFWLRSVYTTGVSDLIQLLVLEPDEGRTYLITWNFKYNREHSLYQTSMARDIYPHNCVVRSLGSARQHNFNFYLEEGAIINLETNVPAQYIASKLNNPVPTGILYDHAQGQKRISDDLQRYLDLRHPGKLHHFYSLMDLLYWKRYQTAKESHELTRSKMTTISPAICFPRGISLLHYLSDNPRLLGILTSTLNNFMQNKDYHPLSKFLRFVVLHRPQFAVGCHRQTPIHLAYEKQVPASQEIMLNMINTGPKNISATRLFGDIIDIMIENHSQAALTFFDASFIVTAQYQHPRMLNWPFPDKQELVFRIPTSFITDSFLQKLVLKSANLSETKSEKANLNDSSQNMSLDEQDSLLRYTESLEIEKSIDNQHHNKMQVQARLLDFDWVFVNNNGVYLIRTLAKTKNDKIFEQEQIRVFVNFMWGFYQKEIKRLQFYPFMALAISFILYIIVFSKSSDCNLSWTFVGHVVSLIVFGKMWIKFVMLEIIQIISEGKSYFSGLWNYVDWAYIVLTMLYVCGNLFPRLFYDNLFDLNLVGGFGTVCLYVKMFHLMKIFRMFTTFVRMIQDMIKDVSVFAVMLLIVLFAFTNCVLVFNYNRNIDQPIFDAHVGYPMVDALIHTWLTVLGEYQIDHYGDDNSLSIWIAFLVATAIIQLVFMSLLIAIMSEAYSRLSTMKEPSTLQSLCMMMEDSEFLVHFDKQFQKDRYILWLGGQKTKKHKKDSYFDKKAKEIKDYVSQQIQNSDSIIQRKLKQLEEKQISTEARQEDKQNEILEKGKENMFLTKLNTEIIDKIDNTIFQPQQKPLNTQATQERPGAVIEEESEQEQSSFTYDSKELVDLKRRRQAVMVSQGEFELKERQKSMEQLSDTVKNLNKNVHQQDKTLFELNFKIDNILKLLAQEKQAKLGITASQVHEFK